MDLHVRAELGHITGLAKDKAVNTFNFAGPGTLLAPQIDSLEQAVVDFYNEIATGALVTLGSLLSGELSRASSQASVKVYNVTGKLSGLAPVGSPISERTFTLVGAAQANSMPSEVAYAVTLEALGRPNQQVEAPDGADPGAEVDRPRQRYTGRVYLGPLNENCKSMVGGIARPASTIRDTSHLAFVQLSADVLAIGAYSVSVWSRRDAVMRGLDFVSSDDAFDTMRSRGASPTIRTRVDIP